MKPWILGVALAGLTAGGVSFLAIGAGNRCGSCPTATEKTPPAAINAELASDEGTCCELCQSCQPKPNKVYDVVDLTAGLPNATVEVPFVSFDEPPLAKAKGGVVVTVGFEETPQGVEVLPPPREVK